MICPVLLNYPDEFISNTEVVRNRSTNPNTPPTHVSDVLDTSVMISSPSDTLSGNHPEPVLHPRMNSRSVHRVSYNVRVSIIIHLSCHALFAMIALYLLFLPPYSPIDPVAAADYTAAAYDYVVDDSTPTVELPGKQCPHLFLISPICLCISIALGIVAATLLSY